MRVWPVVRRCVGLPCEVLTVDSVPLVLVFTLGQLHDLAKAAAPQGGLGILSQLVARCSLLATGSRSELVSPVVAPICM